jgi:predicted Fe-S protein YdhL (DUF1289 family)
MLQDDYARARAEIQRDGDRSRYPLSPCVLLCTLDGDKRCLGCLRTMDEISRWALMSIEEQWAVIDALVALDAND